MPDPWVIFDRVSENTPAAESMQPLLTMLVATVLARRDLADSARTVITRVRESHPRNHELDVLEAEARLTLGETDTAAALLRRFVTASRPHSLGMIASRRFAAIRELVHDLLVDER